MPCLCRIIGAVGLSPTLFHMQVNSLRRDMDCLIPVGYSYPHCCRFPSPSCLVGVASPDASVWREWQWHALLLFYFHTQPVLWRLEKTQPGVFSPESTRCLGLFLVLSVLFPSLKNKFQNSSLHWKLPRCLLSSARSCTAFSKLFSGSLWDSVWATAAGLVTERKGKPFHCTMAYCSEIYKAAPRCGDGAGEGLIPKHQPCQCFEVPLWATHPAYS